MRVNNPDADPLRRVLMRYSRKVLQKRVIKTTTVNEGFTQSTNGGGNRNINISQEKLKPLSGN